VTDGSATGGGRDDRLDALERAVTRMEVVLVRHPPQFSLPSSAIALLTAPVPIPDPADLSPAERARLAQVMDRLEAVRADLRRRQRAVAGRLGAVSAALRFGRPSGAVRFDRRA
jgi:hypothetical protein